MQIVLFWTLTGLAAFGWALAFQMRVMVALVLRRALAETDGTLGHRQKANAVVALAVRPGTCDDINAQHLRESYPAALGHLRTARVLSGVLPVLLSALLGLGRFVWGVI